MEVNVMWKWFIICEGIPGQVYLVVKGLKEFSRAVFGPMPRASHPTIHSFVALWMLGLLAAGTKLGQVVTRMAHDAITACAQHIMKGVCFFFFFFTTA